MFDKSFHLSAFSMTTLGIAKIFFGGYVQIRIFNGKVEKILKGIMDSISSPSPSMKMKLCAEKFA